MTGLAMFRRRIAPTSRASLLQRRRILPKPPSLDLEIRRYRELVQGCLDLARKVDDPAAAERLRKLADDYLRQLNRLLEMSGKRRR